MNATLAALAMLAATVAAILWPRRADAEPAPVGNDQKPAPAPAPAQVLAIDRDTRGFRNRNPGNLRYVASIAWQGQTGGDSGGYAVFDSDLNGLRAAFLNLHAYMHKHGLRTVRGIITRWAPNHENPTDAYVQYVARSVNVQPDRPVSWEVHALPIMRAIVAFENGRNPYADALYRDALRATGKA